MPEDESLVITIKCTNCGATWPVTEDNPKRPETVTKTDTYRCATCGEAAVFEVNTSTIQPPQG
jgi:endogenous inhibitor of DNA gyrase (YacG/DUF329 family)